MNKHDPILIGLVREFHPSLIADDLVGVQPMSSPSTEFNNVWTLKIRDKEPRKRFGDLIHYFVEGYMIFGGKKMIYPEEFTKRFPDIHWEEIRNLK